MKKQKIEIVDTDRPYETVGEAVRAEVLKEVEDGLNSLVQWSACNSLTDNDVVTNKYLIDEIIPFCKNLISKQK